jgi:hypothetical protein
MVALLFPVILILVQTTFRLTGQNREREIGLWFRAGVLMVGLAILYLYTLSNELVTALEQSLSGQPFGETVQFLQILFLLLAGGSAFLLIDAYFEALARDGDSDTTPNTVQMELPTEEDDE